MSFTDSFTDLEVPNLNLVRLPEIKLNKSEFSLVKKDVDNNIDFLKQLINKGWIEFRDQIEREKWPEYLARIKEEFEIIDDLGFIDYFLLVWRVVNKAYELGAFMDWGRGSAAGSLIFFLIGVTGVDPIDKGLFFSRFISRARAKKEVIDGIIYIHGDLGPDVDINLGGVREEIIQWLNEEYPGRISKIAALSTFSGKILIKDVLKVVEEANEDAAQDAAELVGKKFGVVNDLYDLYNGKKKDGSDDWDIEPSEKFIDWVGEHQKVYNICLKLRGLIRAKTTHASGYFLCNEELVTFAPLELNKEGDLSLSFDMGNAAKIGLKLDLLGLISNSIVKNILENLPEKIESFRPGYLTKFFKLDDNFEIYKEFQDGNLLPYGLYQISADCAYGVCQSIKPANIIELSDVNAIARPAALQYQKPYLANSGQSPHPIFDDSLKWTRYQPLYQEESILMATKLGFTAEEGEILRRVIGKKKLEEVKEWKKKIGEKCGENDIDPVAGDEFWKLVEASASYQFNFSHSISVAYLGALTVLLKYKYPLQYYTACLKHVNKFADPMGEIAAIQKELHHFNIKLLPPHLIYSDESFKIEGENIRYGLGDLKGIAGASICNLIKFRGNYKEKNLASNKIHTFLSAKESKLHLGTVCALIQCGALENFCHDRPRGVLEYQLFNLLTDKEKRLLTEYAEQNEENDIIDIVKILKEKGLIKESRYGTISKKGEKYKEMYAENVKNQEVSNYFFEKSLIGFSYSSSLVEIFKKKNPNYCDIENFEKSRILIAQVSEFRRNKSKNGNVYIKYNLIDDKSSVTGLLFENRFVECPMMDKIGEDSIVSIKGAWTNDRKSIFIDSITPQNGARAIMKLRDLK